MKLQTITTLALAASIQISSAGLGIGDPISDTDVKMKSVDGRMVSIGDAKGEKGTLVIFTCNHCPFVVAWQERMVELSNTYQKKGLGVIFINSNNPQVNDGDNYEGMQKMAKENGYEFPYVVDATSDVARHFGAKKTPDIFLFDAEGKLIYHGAVDDNSRKPKEVQKTYLKDALDALLAGNPVVEKETKAVGCGIKFR